jgi:hypothetical protein
LSLELRKKRKFGSLEALIVWYSVYVEELSQFKRHCSRSGNCNIQISIQYIQRKSRATKKTMTKYVDHKRAKREPSMFRSKGNCSSKGNRNTANADEFYKVQVSDMLMAEAIGLLTAMTVVSAANSCGRITAGSAVANDGYAL